MKWQTWLYASLLVLVAMQGVALAQGGDRPIQFVNRLRVEYDDNVRQVDNNPDSSMKIIEEMEFLVNMNLEQTYVSVRYRPSFVWWSDRDEDDTDLHHDFDFVLNHTFSPRVSMSIKDTFRSTELPELIDDRTVVREDDDYVYNALNGTLGVTMRPDFRVDGSARYVLLRYSDSDVSDREDYDLLVGGLSLMHQLVPETMIVGDIRVEDIDYESEADRGSSTIQVGGGLDHIFNPNLLGNVRIGYQNKDLNDARTSSESSPYGEASVTFLPSPATRLTGGIGYSLYEADVFPFASQERTQFFANLAHDLTAKVSWYLSGIITQGDYAGENLPVDSVLGDLPPKVTAAMVEGLTEEQAALVLAQPLTDEFVDSIGDQSEEIFQISSRITYKVNRQNWIEAGWQYSNLDSDMRENFDRNRIHVGWKTKL